MSCFICNVETISVIVKGFTDLCYNGRHAQYRADDYADLKQSIISDLQIMRDAIGQSLLNQNYNSVNCRYAEDTKPPKFQYVDIDINEGILYGCIKCYEYQACESDDYFKSKIHFSLVRLQELIIKRLLKKAGQESPYGYNGYNMLNL